MNIDKRGQNIAARKIRKNLRKLWMIEYNESDDDDLFGRIARRIDWDIEI